MGVVLEPPDDAVDPDADTPKEACGVFGVYAPGQPVAHLTYLGLYALQHRVQESSGMAVTDDSVGRRDGRVRDQALNAVHPRMQGAFSFVIADEGHLIGVRDPNGFRPLCLGKLDEGWVLASETPALDVIGAHVVREVEPGE